MPHPKLRDHMRGLEAKHIVQPTLNTEDPCWKWQKRFKDICQIVWSMVCLSDIAGGGQPLNEKPDTVAADVHIGRTIPHFSTLFHTLLQSSNVPTSHYTVSAALFRRGLWRRRLEPSHLPILQNHPFFYPRPWSKKARVGYKNTQLL